MMPTPRDPESFSFWLATLMKRRPRPHEKLDLLQITDTRERISRGLIYLRAEEQGCRLPCQERRTIYFLKIHNAVEFVLHDGLVCINEYIHYEKNTCSFI